MVKRPIGITLLSVLLIITGLAFIGIQLIFSNKINEVFSGFGINSITTILSLLFLGISSLVAGIGMIIRKKWGWWLGAFYFVYAIFRYINVIVMAFSLEEELQNSSRGIAYYVFQNSIKIIVHFLIFLYFFSNNVLEYFKLENYSKKQGILIFVVGFGITFLLASVSYFLN